MIPVITMKMAASSLERVTTPLIRSYQLTFVWLTSLHWLQQKYQTESDWQSPTGFSGCICAISGSFLDSFLMKTREGCKIQMKKAVIANTWYIALKKQEVWRQFWRPRPQLTVDPAGTSLTRYLKPCNLGLNQWWMNKENGPVPLFLMSENSSILYSGKRP